MSSLLGTPTTLICSLVVVVDSLELRVRTRKRPALWEADERKLSSAMSREQRNRQYSGGTRAKEETRKNNDIVGDQELAREGFFKSI